jgi:hypothetical protein
VSHKYMAALACVRVELYECVRHERTCACMRLCLQDASAYASEYLRVCSMSVCKRVYAVCLCASACMQDVCVQARVCRMSVCKRVYAGCAQASGSARA